MSPEKPTDAPPPSAEDPPEGEDAPAGVFGNLPQTRPGSRSPRREAGAQRTRGGRPSRAKPTAGKGRAGPSSAGRGREGKAAEATAGSKAPRDPAQAEPGEGVGSRGGIEDVAWAGVAAAAEAATIGVRLATRALEAMRDAVDRR